MTGASRLRLRRRLLVFSAPLVVVVLLAAAKLISVVVAGDSAVSHFGDGDAAALQQDASTLRVLNMIEPEKAPFAAGVAAVLRGQLDEAEALFSEALSLTDVEQSCPVLINLELVRERRGDIDAWEGRPDQARERYRSALDSVSHAPGGCFEGNTDPDAERRAVRNDAAARLGAKIAGAGGAPPPSAPAPPPAPPPPASPPPAVASDPEDQRGQLRLDPGTGDPIDKLRQILQDAAG